MKRRRNYWSKVLLLLGKVCVDKEMDKVKLGDVSERGSSNLAQKDIEGLIGNYPIYGAAGYIGTVDFYHQKKDYIAVVKDGAGIGRTMFLPAKSSVLGTLQYIIPNERVVPKYLYYAVKHMNLAKYCTGATIPHIYYKDYKNEIFGLPDIPKQREVVFILEKTEKIMEGQKQELLDLENLIKSRFVEMFGDPVSNPFRWDKVLMNECLENIDNGKSFVCDTVARVGEHPAILKLSAVTYGIYKPEENKRIISESDFVENAEVREGDLLFTRKNTPELVGMAAYVASTPPKLMMPDLIFRLNTKNNCNKVFLWQLINHDLFRKQIQSIASGSAKSMSNISKERLGKFSIYLPPIELQNQFAAFVHQIDKLKFPKLFW